MYIAATLNHHELHTCTSAESKRGHNERGGRRSVVMARHGVILCVLRGVDYCISSGAVCTPGGLTYLLL